jgi:hypothetical protein
VWDSNTLNTQAARLDWKIPIPKIDQQLDWTVYFLYLK